MEFIQTKFQDIMHLTAPRNATENVGFATENRGIYNHI